MQYIAHELVNAVPALCIGGDIYRKDAPIPCHDEDVTVQDGYEVTYADGFKSFCEKEYFERVARPTVGMSFGLAIEAMKQGRSVARRGWNGKNQHIELASCISYVSPGGGVVNVQHEAIGNMAVAFVGTSGVQMGWLASQADMLAEDWIIV